MLDAWLRREEGERDSERRDNGWREDEGGLGNWNLRDWAKQMGGGGWGGSLFRFFQAVWIGKTERQRECECEWVSSQCSCVPALHSFGTEVPLSETNELRATSFSHPKWASVYWVYWVHLHSKAVLTVGCLFAVMSVCYWFFITTDDQPLSVIHLSYKIILFNDVSPLQS